MNANEIIALLNKEEIKEAKEILCAFNRIYAERSKCGKISLSTAVAITQSYQNEYLGEIKNTDLLTKEEWIDGFCKEYNTTPRSASMYLPKTEFRKEAIN